MPPVRIARSRVDWRDDTACVAAALDELDRVVARVEVGIAPETREEMEQNLGTGWRTHVEDFARKYLRSVLDLRDPTRGK